MKITLNAIGDFIYFLLIAIVNIVFFTLVIALFFHGSSPSVPSTGGWPDAELPTPTAVPTAIATPASITTPTPLHALVDVFDEEGE